MLDRIILCLLTHGDGWEKIFAMGYYIRIFKSSTSKSFQVMTKCSILTVRTINMLMLLNDGEEWQRFHSWAKG
jgi:hypothetical protein